MLLAATVALAAVWIGYSRNRSDDVAAAPEKRGATTTPDFSRATGKIVFQTDRDGNNEIYVINPDGTGLLRLTRNASYDGYPAWSPDGTKIAFESNRGGFFQIYVMGSDGANPVRITEGPFENRFPSWSPDGKHVAYQSKRDNGLQIYAMDIESKKERSVTRTWHKSGLPSWAPDGRSIAFTANKLLGWGVYIMGHDGSNIQALDTEGGSCRPKWKKDGSKIAYVSQKADNKGDVWVMKRDGSDKKRLTTDSANYDYFPSWSSDGQWIVYSKTSHKERGNWELWIIHVETGASKQITNHPAQDMYPDWH